MTPLYMVSWEVLRSRACLGGDRADEPASARLSPLVNEFSHVLLGGGEPQTINPFPPQSYPLNTYTALWPDRLDDVTHAIEANYAAWRTEQQQERQ